MALLEINDQESWGLGREITSQLLSTIRWQTGKIRYIRRKQIQRWLRQCSVFHPHNVNYAEVPGKAPWMPFGASNCVTTFTRHTSRDRTCLTVDRGGVTRLSTRHVVVVCVRFLTSPAKFRGGTKS